jgi:hypothetical protein
MNGVCLRVGQVYVLKELKNILQQFALSNNFEIRRNGFNLHCWRGYGNTAAAVRDRCKEEERQRDRKSVMKCGCEWAVTFTPDKDDVNVGDDKVMMITNVKDVHTHGCNPTPIEQLAVLTSSTKPRPIDLTIWSQLIHLRKETKN